MGCWRNSTPISPLRKSSPPPVVVPTHHRHRDSGVHQRGQSSKHPGMPTGDHALVLEPEVEQVSVDDNSGRFPPAYSSQARKACSVSGGATPKWTSLGEKDGWTLHYGLKVED